jgi:hypothetical protein
MVSSWMNEKNHHEKKSRYTEQNIGFALKKAELDIPLKELDSKMREGRFR